MRSNRSTANPAIAGGDRSPATSLGEHALMIPPEMGLGCSLGNLPPATPDLHEEALHLDRLYEPTPTPMYLNPTDRSWLRHAAWTLALLLATWLPASAQQANRPIGHQHDQHHSDALDELLHQYEQRIEFTENKGQFGKDVLYRADFPYGQALATPQGMFIRTFDPDAIKARQEEGMRIEQDMHDGKPSRPLTWRERGHGWMMSFQGALPTMRVGTRQAHPEVNNYFTGGKEALDVRSYQEVWYNGVYDNIDVRYYPAEDGSLEYDIVCKPGSDPRKIAVEFKGIEKLRVGNKGELVMATSLGDMSYPAPIVYQRINGREKPVKAAYTVTKSNVLGFTLGEYDKSQPLVIDPIAMRWATWVNTNSSGDNHGHCIWVDPSDGAIYIVARVVGTTDNITLGAFDTSANGNLEMIVGKYLEPANVGGAGTRVWQTYIGGNNDDNPYAMEQGPDGNLYITGYTGSTNFPTLGGTAFSGSSINQQAQAGNDIFVLKMNTAGNSIKAAVVGGGGADESYDIRTAANGDVFVCGSTTSTNLSTLNSGSGASNTNNGGSDVLVFRINQDLSSLVWMRNYGGNNNGSVGTGNESYAETANIMLYNSATDDLFVGGTTNSSNFPTLNPRQSTRGGTSAGFLQRLTGSNGNTVWSSYYTSSSGLTKLLCMEFNNTKTELYFGGVTAGLNSANLTSGAYDTSHNGSNDFFVGRMGIDQTYLGGTYVGGSGSEVNMMGLNVDLNNDVYVFGYSSSTNFPVSSAPNVPLQTTRQGSSGNDKVFFKLESDLGSLEFSTYYGGTADDYDPVGERGIKFSNCRIYTIVTAQSNNIPLTQGALNTSKVSSTSRYEPGLVVWANPPDLLGNSISYTGTAICAGSVPGDITGSLPSYMLPIIVRNNSASAYPSFGSAATYQWQISTDSVNWTNISGQTGQHLPGSAIGVINETRYIRRIIGGDACILAGAADQVVTVRIMSVRGEVTPVTCNGAANGSITATADGLAPFQYAWSNGQTTQTATNLAPGSYTVVVTDANGCTAEGTFQMTQPVVLSATPIVTPATCSQANGGSSLNVSGGNSPYSYQWSTGSTGASIAGVTGGLYTVIVTDSKGCEVTVEVNIPSTGLPTVDAGAIGVITCATGPQVTLTGSAMAGMNYSWVASNGGQIVSGANTLTPVVNAAGTYTLTVTNPQSGCSASDATTVTLNTTPPNVSVSGGGTLTCSVTSFTLNGGSTTAGVSYSWSGPNGFTSTDEDVVVDAAGTYILTVTDPANGCSAQASAQVQVNNTAPGATAQGGTLTCTTTSIALSGSGNGTFAWSGPNGFTSTEQNPTVFAAGTYTLVVTGANGCTSQASATVILDSTAPGATAQGGTLTCITTSIALSGTGNGTYAWSGPNGFTSTEQNPTVNAAGTYTLTVTGANGCTSTATATVILDSTAPGATAQGGTLTCTTTSIALSGSGNGTYAWSGPNGYTSTEQNPTVNAAGTYTLTVTGTNGCTSEATAVVSLDEAAPGAQAVGGVLNCNVSSITLSGSGNGSFAWSGPNGFNSTEQNPTVNAAGTYTLVVTGANGCTSQASATVILDNTAPGATAQGGTLTCTTTSIALSGSGNGSFAWSGPNGFSSNEQNPTVFAAGTYTLVVTGANGCTSQASATVILDNTAPGALAQGGTLTCTTTSITLSGSGNGTYAWSGLNGFTSNEQNPTVFAAGTYTLVVTGANGCTSQASATVILDNTAPGATAQGGTLTCTTTSIALSGSGNGSFAWSGPNGFSSNEQNPTVNAAGTYALTVTGANGCTSTATATVLLDSTAPGATAQGGTLTCTTTSIVLSGSGNGTYAWSGPNGFTSTEQNPTVNAAGTYTLTVTGANGCTSTATATVILDSTAPGATAQGGTLTCTTSSIALSGSGNGTFAWSGPNGFSSNEQNPTVNAAGTYTLVVTGPNGCTSQASATVILDSTAPGATAQGGTLTCTTTSIALSGSGNGTFAWSGPNGFTSNEQNPTVSAAGSYTLVVTGANGCTSEATAVVTLDEAAPGAQAVGGVLNCNVSSITLSGSGNGSFAWSGPNGFNSAEQNPTVNAAGTYTLTVTGANGCTSTATATVLLDNTAPGASAQGGTLTCTTTSITLSGSGNGTYAWSGLNGFSSNEQNPTVNAAGTYTLTVTGTNGCTSEATAVVSLDEAAPGAQAAGGVLNCNVSSITLSGSGNGSFAWSGPNGYSSNEQNPTVNAAGTYTLIVTGANGCTSEATAVVSLDEAVPGAQATGGVLNCNVSSITLSGSGNGSYAWSGPNGFTSSEQNPTVNAAGTYTLVVTGANGCTSEATAVVSLDEAAPGAQAAGGVLNCNVSSINLSGNGNGTFAWSGPNGFTSNEQNPTVNAAGTYTLTVTGANGCTSTATAVVTLDDGVPSAQAQGGVLTCTITSVQIQGMGFGTFAWTGPNGFSSNEQNPTVNAAGTYILVVTGANGCTSEATAEVTADTTIPYVSANGGELNCLNGQVILNANGNGTFQWIGPNGFTSNEQFPLVTVAGTYTVTITASNGCTNSATTTVTSDTNTPEVTIAGGLLPCEGGTVILNAFTDATNPNYAWSGPNGFTSTGASIVVTETGLYTVVVTLANGCTGNATYAVQRTECGEKECPALISNCPANITVDCAADYSPEAEGGMPTFRVDGGTGDKKCAPVKNSGWWDEVTSTCPYVVRRTFWAVDMDGNAEYCEQLITIVDLTGPVMIGVPTSDITLGCEVDLDNYQLPSVWAFDECSKSAMNASLTSTQVGEPYDGAYSVVHTWTATDECGNESVATWTIYVDCKDPGKGEGFKKLEVSAAPNPFRKECVISLVPKESGKAVVTITDMQGRRIAEAFNGTVYAGETTRITFSPEKVGTGAFLYHVQMDGEQIHGRLMHQP